MRAALIALAYLLLAPVASGAQAQDSGAEIYARRCRWCHGDQGLGDGPSAVGMLPRPRDFVRGEYKIRSTPHGSLPTDEDLFDVISRGLPGTPMEGWENVLSEAQIRQLVAFIESLNPRFDAEAREPVGPPPGTAGSADRGEQVYREAKCFLCHGVAGRGDGGITTTLNFEWGIPYGARDLRSGWTFKGGHQPRDIYTRITTGLDGTPMGPYRDLLSEQERWDLTAYVGSLDREPVPSSEDFVVAATWVNGDLPDQADDPAWSRASVALVPLAGQVVQDPPLRWWTPTVTSLTARALWNGAEIGFLLEWHDPTGPAEVAGAGTQQVSSRRHLPDSALMQFAPAAGRKPYFLLGDSDNPVRVWRWQAGGPDEEWSARGSDAIELRLASFEASASWEAGRWQVIFRRSLGGDPQFEVGAFVPVLFSVHDGANGETRNLRAISTWLYATVQGRRSLRAWLWPLAVLLGGILLEMVVLANIRMTRS